MVNKSKNSNIKPLPFLEKVHEGISRIDYVPYDYQYINESLKHNLRPYQLSALFSLDWVQKHDEVQQHNHLMFNMATGSGKTDVMASNILYLFKEYGYTNFLFVTNSNAIVNKTKENFLNSNSSKYLFATTINIDGQLVDIKQVKNFPLNQQANAIYIKLTTIQSLSNEINYSKENGLTIEDLENYKIVILADEAHHFNAQTKSQKQKETSWEEVLDRVRNANKLNIQLEYTATIDIDKDEVYEKYKNKIIYKYDLNRFMDDGYSKKVFRLEANNDNNQKLLNAILLSQYRKRIAHKLNISDFKPVVLVKSNRIKTSEKVKDSFLQMMEDLSSEFLAKFISENAEINKNSMALSKAYEYWKTQDLSKAVEELQRDFNIKTTINVNEGGTKGIVSEEADFKKLNSLEDINNPFRIIFAVAKLTEGWDVLNLFDIVRISEEKESKTIKQTNAEAQLIGRGARYYPFVYKGEKSYTRRFDTGADSTFENQLLESLYYHTINDSGYIKNLNKSFDNMNLIANQDGNYQVFSADVKKTFLKSNFYKNGNIYYNKTVQVPDSEYRDLKAYGIDNQTMIINYSIATTESSFKQAYTSLSENKVKLVNVVDFSNLSDYRLVKKAIAKNTFFRFSEMKQYLPELTSIREFITSPNWLGNISILARVPNEYTLNLDDKLKVISIALKQIQAQVVKNYRKEKGTNIFVPISVKETVKDYSKLVPQRSNKTISEIILPKDMSAKEWYPYSTAIVDQLEMSFINLLDTWVNKLKEKYKEIYLIRNEETISKWSLHEFENTDIKHYQGYKPDFIMVLIDADFIYQIYVEPKGDEFLEKDAWKQNLLESIRPEKIKVLAENDNIKLYGVKFYTRGDGRNIREELQDLKILPGAEEKHIDELIL